MSFRSPSVRPRTPRRLAPLLGAVALLIGLTAGPADAVHAVTTAPCSSSPCDIGGAPFDHLYIGPDLSCQVVDGSQAEFTPTASTAGDCGTFLSVGGVLYGPDISTSPGTTSAYTADSQLVPNPLPDGSLPTPFQVTTQVHAGKIAITEVDTYAATLSTYKTRITVTNKGTSTAAVRLYRAADCALAGNDNGFGNVELTPKAKGAPSQLISVGCADSASAGASALSFVSNSVNATYTEGTPGGLWGLMGVGLALPDTCSGSAALTPGPCGPSADNAIGVSWGFSVAPGASVVRGTQTNLNTEGNTPLTEVLKADRTGGSPEVDSGSLDGYTITIHNPTNAAVDIDSVTDYLKPGFVYRAGSTTGDLGTADPVGSSTLTWTGSPLGTVPARGDVSLHFNVTVPSAGGNYTNAASATTAGPEVAPTGPSAKIKVTQTYALSLTKAGTGDGTVVSSPAGIACGSSCGSASKAFAPGTKVTLTPTKALGSRFVGWSGACTGTAPCVLTMVADEAVTATFDRVCTRVAFSRLGDIETVDAPVPGSLTDLTNTPAVESAPAWSPNCAKIAFTSTESGTPQIWVMPAAGGPATRITSGLRPSSQPTWSADGTKLAFTSTRSGKAQIYVVAASGGVAKRITHDTAADTQPAWSPVGSRIVFTSTAGGRAQLWSVLSNGSGLTRLTAAAGTSTQASWSPTGQRLVFVSTRDGRPEAWVMGANGSLPTRITASATAISHPTWSPDGRQIVFARGGDIWLRPLIGTALTNLTHDPEVESWPAWSS